MAEKFANSASTTINQGGGIAAGDTSVIVTSAALFPSSGNFRILIDSEIILVTAVSGSTFTIVRGQESTSAASHANGAGVTHILTAGAITQAKADAVLIRSLHSTINNGASPYTVTASDDTIQVDTSGGVVTINAPASPTTGQVFFVQDVGGAAATNNITVNGNGKNIGGGTTFVILTNYAGQGFLYNGTLWVPTAFQYPTPTHLWFFSGNGTWNTSSYSRLGGASIDMSMYPAQIGHLTRSVKFVCDYSVSNNADVGNIQLWDATNGVIVTGTTNSTSSLSTVRFQSSALTVGASSGNIRNDATTQYEIQAALTTGPTTDRVTVLSARLTITYA